MGKIHVLDDVLANKIAAGEVIERPSNVVKELVENSIDAHATTIQIEVEDGGISSIRIIDNGDGMSEEDAKLCFGRHATSKIQDDFDLFRITSLGFRGEAIPSIASISHFDLQTSQGDVGTHIIYEYGKPVLVESADGRKGTTIEVTRLFTNVPARLKYLKSINAEFASIQSFVERLSLSYPNIGFTLVHQGKTVFRTNGNGNLLEVLGNFYGFTAIKNMIPVDFGDEEFHITGYISKIDLTRATKSYIMTMVNHRVVRNTITIDTVNEVYRKYLFPDRYPICCLNIEVDPFLVDVNVHPSKMEVRFSKTDHLKELIKEGITKALSDVDLTYRSTYEPPKAKPQFEINQEQMTMDLSASPVVEERHIVNDGKQQFIDETGDIYFDKAPLDNVEIKEIVKPSSVVLKPLKKQLRAKCQVRGTYIICEDDEGFYIVDQHAAKERVNYEYYLEKFDQRDMLLSDMLIPIILHYPPSECTTLLNHAELLEAVGIHLEEMGPNTLVVKQLPQWMRQVDEQTYIETMIDQVLHNQSIDVTSLRLDAIATASCKASVKGNTFLNLENMQSILNELMRCDNPYVCPHGRPTMIAYSDYEIEKLFKRVV